MYMNPRIRHLRRILVRNLSIHNHGNTTVNDMHAVGNRATPARIDHVTHPTIGVDGTCSVLNASTGSPQTPTIMTIVPSSSFLASNHSHLASQKLPFETTNSTDIEFTKLESNHQPNSTSIGSLLHPPLFLDSSRVSSLSAAHALDSAALSASHHDQHTTLIRSHFSSNTSKQIPSDSNNDTQSMPDISCSIQSQTLSLPPIQSSIDARSDTSHQLLTRRLNTLRFSEMSTSMKSSASSFSVHQMFQEHLSMVVHAPCHELCCSYFTLAENSYTLPFYTSEWIDLCNNPSWDVLLDSISMSYLHQCLPRFMLSLYFNLTRNPAAVSVISQWIDLANMSFVCKDLIDLDLQFQPNTILIELENGFYMPRTSVTNDCPPVKSVDLKVQLTKVKPNKVYASYKYAQIKRIIGLQRQITKVQASTNTILVESAAHFAKLEVVETVANEADAIRIRINVTENAIMEQTRELQNRSLRLNEIRQIVNERQMQLSQLQVERDEEVKCFLRARDGLALTRKEMSCILSRVSKLQKSLTHDLKTMFPITETDCPCIRGIKLPNSNFTGHDDERIATALGFTAHFITLLAYYLDVPLRYYMMPISSRSTVWDVVSQQFQGSKEFPLYSRGSERIRFEYAVFLINKNVEQLLNFVGKPVKNLRNTLPNLKLLCDTIESWHELNDETLESNIVNWEGITGSNPNRNAIDNISVLGSALESEIEIPFVSQSNVHSVNDRSNVSTSILPITSALNTDTDLQKSGNPNMTTQPKNVFANDKRLHSQAQIPSTSSSLLTHFPVRSLDVSKENPASVSTSGNDTHNQNGVSAHRNSVMNDNHNIDSVSLNPSSSSQSPQRRLPENVKLGQLSSAPRISLVSQLMWGASEMITPPLMGDGLSD
ncbi:hypothetical protein BDV3_004313 [Batrachochytrium dendrobatidis]